MMHHNGNISASRVPGRSPLIAAISPISKHRLRTAIYIFLLATDCVGIILANATADFSRGALAPSYATLSNMLLFLPLFVAIAVGDRKIYGIDFFTKPHKSVKSSIIAVIKTLAVILFIEFCLKNTSAISRVQVITTAIIFAAWVAIGRVISYKVAMILFEGRAQTEILVHDEGDRHIKAPSPVAKSVDLDIVLDLNDPGMFDRWGTFLAKADRVLVSCPQDRRKIWSVMLKSANIKGEILAPELIDIGPTGVGWYEGIPTLVVSTGPLGTRSRALKRAMDLLITTMALFALLPLLAVVALAIKLDDGGPIFFTQTRLGRSNRLFSLYKFRSMRADACDTLGTRSTDRGDLRITRIGQFIRATSIDELPQLINVLKGDMSLVGPRPHALGSLAEDQLFWEVDARYWQRHAIKPGITGLAQVRGFRGATHLQTDLINRLQADLEYLSGWTLWRDIKIVFATLRVLLHQNAY